VQYEAFLKATAKKERERERDVKHWNETFFILIEDIPFGIQKLKKMF